MNKSFSIFLFALVLFSLKTNALFANQEIRDVWNHKANQWHDFVGKRGEKDLNRRFQVDPAIQSAIGSLSGKTVLDAGSGTGYFSAKMAAAAARVIGIDISERMVDIANQEFHLPNLEFLVGNLEDISGIIPDESVDIVVSNHVLMDLADLDAAVGEFSRVLKPGGKLVIAILHPCFPINDLVYAANKASIEWKASYFDNRTVLIPPFSEEFDTDFVVFQRPLSTYMRTMMVNGLQLLDFIEPVASDRNRFDLPREVFNRFKHVPISLVLSFIKS